LLFQLFIINNILNNLQMHPIQDKFEK